MEDHRGPAAYVAEFLGTLILTFAIATAVTVNHITSGQLNYANIAVIALVHALTLAMLVVSLGGTSGAHFNPAVTIGLAAVRKISPRHAGGYLATQLAGGLCGALLVKVLLTDEGHAVKYAAPAISTALSGRTGLGFLAELIGTFFLVWAIMAAAVNPLAERGVAPWIIGGTLGLSVMLFGPLTGGSFNPARAFGPAVVGSGFGDAGRWIVAYALGPIAGAVLAALGYRALVLVPQGRAPGARPIDTLD